MITLDLSKAKLSEDLESYKDKVKEIHDMIHNKLELVMIFLGGLNYLKIMIKLKLN